MAQEVSFDVGIIGGGPAGSAMAGYLAKAGLKTAVFEKEMFPRPHVGESLVPACNQVLRELGIWDQLLECGFPRKTGAAWSANARKAGHGPKDPEQKGRVLAFVNFEGKTSTFHVDRAKFDLMLLSHARSLGASVFTGTGVKNVDFSDPEQPVIRVEMGKEEVGVRVRMVVDASGRRALLGSQMKLKQHDTVLDQYALHSWFQGFDRETFGDDPAMDNFIYIHFLPIANSWVWQIPISETVTSVGVVTPRSLFRGRNDEREEFFWECLRSYPKLAEGLQRAKRIRPFTAEADYSYSLKEICGDGFLTIGDAGCFVDPIFSSGVSLALNGARLASYDIIAAAQAGDFRKERFAAFEKTLRRGQKNWHEFISLYYRLNVLFATFLQDVRYRKEIFELIQGNFYGDGDPEILSIMRRTVREIESAPEHPWHGMLGTLVAAGAPGAGMPARASL
jgi:FADH2 O2-dependent halogenase